MKRTEERKFLLWNAKNNITGLHRKKMPGVRS